MGCFEFNWVLAAGVTLFAASRLYRAANRDGQMNNAFQTGIAGYITRKFG